MSLFLFLFLVLLHSFVFLADLVESLHVLMEIGAAFKNDEEFGLLRVTVVSAWYGDRLGVDLLEYRVVIPGN